MCFLHAMKAGGRGITLGSLARDPAQVSVIPLKTFQGEELTHRRDSEVSFSSSKFRLILELSRRIVSNFTCYNSARQNKLHF